MLEPFGKGHDETFGINSELFKSLNRGTTLVEYRYVLLMLHKHPKLYIIIIIYYNEQHCFPVAALQISQKNSMLDICDPQLLVRFIKSSSGLSVSVLFFSFNIMLLY